MKNFINVFITLILVVMGAGIAQIQVNNDGPWFILFFPLIIMMFFWGDKLRNDY